ncbi:MAG: Histone deacetylase domain protein [Methanoregula sp. PtaU1.Bin006]|nr:MAG: Histone deacetylase domain protein [Methanoregula sp. PtaB.Bin085]OPY32296.1 MAG: Histone deacetylase domain protein [Methanoregula sp. PtaU1.Bin006]
MEGLFRHTAPEYHPAGNRTERHPAGGTIPENPPATGTCTDVCPLQYLQNRCPEITYTDSLLAGYLMNYSVITGPVFGQHDCEGHVECRDRLLGIIDQLPQQVTRHEPVPAAPGDIERVHHPGYLKWLRAQCDRNVEYDFVRDSIFVGGQFTPSSLFSGYIDENTYINPHSYEVATYAAGSAIAAVERTLDGESCFALVRPPGHHAAAAWAMGFCLINNIAIAAARALRMVNRIAIIDWDVHHGNGTQDIFYTSDRVLYCSTHQEDAFPHTGHIEETGTGAGTGFTINAPLPRRSTIADISLVFEDVFLPAIARMDPDLILISAGQDVLSDDPVGDMRLQPADLGFLTGLVLDRTRMPLALVLEGGYGPSHGAAVRNILDALGGARPARADRTPAKKTAGLVAGLRNMHDLS